MDVNLMVLNVGNSRLSIGAFVLGELQNVVRVGHAERGRWQQVVADTWKQIANKELPAIAAVSVNPAMAEPLELVVSQVTGRKMAWVGREIEYPNNVLTENPSETGADRILNVAAAYEQMGKACVVVDAGTAVTVDFCSDNGDFLGGAIAPGIGMMLDAMHDKTARLPKIEFAKPVGAVGTSTAAAMCQGVYHGIRGMVKETVENYATEAGHWPDLIATGGDAQVLFGGWELVHAIAPDLTLYGIALAYVENDKRRQSGE